MTDFTRYKKHEFFLQIKPDGDEVAPRSLLFDANYIVTNHNAYNFKTEIQKFIIASDSMEDSKTHWVFIQFNREKEGAFGNYFSNAGARGYNQLSAKKWKATKTSTYQCREQFVQVLTGERWVLEDPEESFPDFIRPPDWLKHQIKDRKIILNFQDVQDP